MKKITVIILIIFIAFAGTVYAEDDKSDNETISQEEKTDKMINDFFNNIEKAIVDSTKKGACIKFCVNFLISIFHLKSI